MATSYTSLLGFALPVTGELDGTWGDVVNNSITQLVEDSVAGVATQSVAGGDWTLTTTGSGAANQARCAILIPTGSPGVSRNIIAPSQSKAYIVVNQSNASVVVKGSATTGATVLAGQAALVAWNGSDFVAVSSGDVDGPSSATDNAVARFNGTTGKVIQDSAVTIADTTGDITGGKYNGLTVSTTTGTFTLTNGKTLAVQNTLTLAGTDSTTMTFPSTSQSIAGLGAAQTWTAAQTFRSTTGTRFEEASTQDAIVIDGRAGGTSSYAITVTPATLSSSTTLTLPNVTDTVATIGTAQTFTAAQTFRAANAIRSEAASTQDAMVLAGRAGGTGSYAVTLTPNTLSANRTVTFPDGNVTMVAGTTAVLGTAQTFTAAQTFRAASAVRSEAASTQDAIVLAGRAGGTSSYAVTLTPATLSSSTTLTLPNVTDTVATIGTAQTFTAAQTFRAANAIRSEAASTQDAIVIAGRAGGTSSYAITLTPATLSASRTVTLPDGGGNYTLGYLNVPQSGSDKTTSYSLATTDVGKFVGVGASGSITIPNATFAAGDVISLFNNTTGNITITCSITTAYIAGTDSDKATMTLATRGVATILFLSGTVCVVSGNVT